MNARGDILIPLGIVGLVVLLATGAVSRFKGWLQSSVRGGSGGGLTTTQDQLAILGPQGAADQQQTLSDISQQAGGGLGAITGGIGAILNGDVFKPLPAGIGGDVLIDKDSQVAIGGTAHQFGGNIWVASGAVQWFDSTGRMTTGYLPWLSGKLLPQPQGHSDQPIPADVLSRVQQDIGVLTPIEIQLLQGNALTGAPRTRPQ